VASGCEAKGLEKSLSENRVDLSALQPAQANEISVSADPETNLDGRPDDPWQHIKTRQSLSARPVRSGGLGRAGQAGAKALGTLWAQILD
jgi:hypothetical protein